MGQIRTLGLGESERSVDEVGIKRHDLIFLWNASPVKEKPPKLDTAKPRHTLPIRTHL